MGEFLLVGNGNVGQAIPERIGDLGLEQSGHIIKSDGTYARQPDGSLEPYSERPDFWNDESIVGDVEMAFITVPSSRGREEAEVIKGLIGRGIMVVTAAKGALADHLDELEQDIDYIGKSATVGGGTRVLPFLEDRLSQRTRQVHISANGTLGFIADGLNERETPAHMVDLASKAGLAEPGATDTLEVINGEAVGDISKKASILVNLAFRPVFFPEASIIRAEDIQSPELNEDDLAKLVREPERRHILSIIREDEEREEDIVAGRRQELDEGWLLISGFRQPRAYPLFDYMRLRGACSSTVMAGELDYDGDGDVLDDGSDDGIYSLAGPGAGPGPTAASMVQDALQLLRY